MTEDTEKYNGKNGRRKIERSDVKKVLYAERKLGKGINGKGEKARRKDGYRGNNVCSLKMNE